MPGNDDLLFAEHAQKGGFVTDEELRESVRVQERMAEMGVRESLRNVLVKRGVMREGDAVLVARAAGLRTGREPIPGYSLEARLGSGAMGSVYRAYQRAMKRHVAIKILRRDLTDDPRQVERLQREAALVGRLDHPHIVRGLDCGESDGIVWFVMEYVEGRTLHERIRKEGPLDPGEAVTIARKMAEAIAHAHAHGVVHRDIKPGNILLAKDGEPRLADYGLAKGETDDALTQLDATLGTPQYIAPEQARNPRDADVRSDIYSLGATLYAMLAGRPPFQAETLAATLTKVLYERPMPLSEAAPGTPREVAYVVERMMAKDRRHRYATPEELVRDLRALELGRLHVPAGFRGDIESFVETRRRRRLTVGATGAVLALAATAAILLGWRRARDEADARVAAREDLAAVVELAGDRATWDGATVDAMIRRLEAHLAAHADAATAPEARAALARWRAQADAIERVQRLALRLASDSEPDWPALLTDLRAESARLERDADADVARRRLAGLTPEVERARDRAARDAVRRACEAVEGLDLLASARRLDEAAGAVRDRCYGVGPAPEAEALADLARDFRRAHELLGQHSAAYDAAVRDGALARDDLGALESRLSAWRIAAEKDAELAQLLSRLPPAGQRRALVLDRYEAERARLVDASARRRRALETEAEELLLSRRFAEAEALLAEGGARLLPADRDVVAELRARIGSRRENEARELDRLVTDTGQEFLDELGAREYRDARETLQEFGSFTAGWVSDDAPAARLVREGGALLELVDRLAWQAFRRRLESGAPLDNGLWQGRGIRSRRVRELVVRGDEVAYTDEAGVTWRGALRDLELSDVLDYSGLSAATDAEAALVAAAMLVTETSRDLEPRRTLERMAQAAPLLDRARGASRLAQIAELVAERRRRLVARAEGELTEAETRAAQLHEEARRALDEGRQDDAARQLESLLTLQRLRRTEYVLRRRDEIERELGRAQQAQTTARYAERLAGARLTEGGGGTATYEIDFDAPDVQRAIRLDPGRTTLRRHDGVPAALAAPSGDDVPVVENRVFAWEAWDGDPAHHPRRSPLVLDSPFLERKRVELSFLYRSDAPYFLLASIGGVNAGVLSAADQREGGRGVALWQSDDLESADAAFGPRHRAQYLQSHPEVLRNEGDTTFFQFEPGRLYRVLLVRDERRIELWVDGRRIAEADLRPAPGGALAGKIVVQSYTGGEIDDVRVTGTLDPEWLRNRR